MKGGWHLGSGSIGGSWARLDRGCRWPWQLYEGRGIRMSLRLVGSGRAKDQEEGGVKG